MERPESSSIWQRLELINTKVVKNAPRVLRPAGLGFGLAALTDHNWPVVGLSFGTAAGSALILEVRRRSEKRQK